MITFKHSGNLSKTKNFLTRAQRVKYRSVLEKYGQAGVNALKKATPVDTGNTAASWDYIIKIGRGTFSISWTNSNVNNGVPIAILLQYGHATRDGSFVQGIDYINPALKPIFDRLADDAWKEITKI